MSLQRDMYMAPVIKYLEEKKLTEAANKGIWKKVKKDIRSIAISLNIVEDVPRSPNNIVFFTDKNITVNEFRSNVMAYLGVSNLDVDEDPLEMGYAHYAVGKTKFKDIEYAERIQIYDEDEEDDKLTIIVRDLYYL